MRFNVKVSFVSVLIICVLFLFIYIPKSPHLQSKASLQDLIDGEARQGVLGSAILHGRTPDPLIVNYGRNDEFKAGEHGRGVIFVGKEEKRANKLMSEYNVNMLASDIIPLNRVVPDSRHPSCQNITYPIEGLKNVTVIVPFYDEGLSLLLRTVYSIINRTPPSLLREIILVDDASTRENLKTSLDQYVSEHFPNDLVRVLRQPERQGLIKARLRGWREARGEVLVFLDSHMEMNIDWVQPLLVEIQKNRKTIAMSVLDYIDAKSLQYNVRPDYIIRYGFNWKLVFFEYYFRDEQIGPEFISPRRGVTMVGAAFAVDKEYFTEIGAYDDGMVIWGGENLELSWRVWLCGGQMLHVPCSHMGHIARFQPYSFPAGRHETEMHNYKRAVEVWMGSMKRYVYESYPEMKDLDVGDISSRLKLKENLKCRNFSWYATEIWPELLTYDIGVIAWGSAKNLKTKTCLDNFDNLYPGDLHISFCHYHLNTQGFSLTKDGLLRTTMTVVVYDGKYAGGKPALQAYGTGRLNTWNHTKNSWLRHQQSGFCLEAVNEVLKMENCDQQNDAQKWTFNQYLHQH